jgi:hypothetical protein
MSGTGSAVSGTTLSAISSQFSQLRLSERNLKESGKFIPNR